MLKKILVLLVAFLFISCAPILNLFAPSKHLCPVDYHVEFDTALQFAKKADLAYEPDVAIMDSCKPDSCHIFFTGKDSTGRKAFVEWDDSAKIQWVAFRGTKTPSDAMADADYTQVPDTALEIYLHDGFAKGANDLLVQLLPHLLQHKSDYMTYVTGHSLGGAMAVITALNLKKQGFQVKVYTFGQPKVTNESGAMKMDSLHLDLIRFIDDQDIVALMPPVDWKPGQKVVPYAHFGREVDLVNSSYECLEEHTKSKDPMAWIGEAEAKKKAVDDHSMAKYIFRLKQLTKK